MSESKPKSTNILSTLSPLLSAITAISVFIFGRISLKLEQREEERKKNRKRESLLIHNIKTFIIHPLIKIETMLTSSIRSVDECFGNTCIEFKIDSICVEAREYKKVLDAHYSKINFELGYLEADNELNSLFYIDKIKNYLSSLSSKSNLSPEDKLDCLSWVRLYRVEGIENMINLSKENGSLQLYINALNQIGRDLLYQRRNRAIKDKKIREGTCEIDLELSTYRDYDIDTEEIVIQKIKEIFRGLEISTLSIDPYINNYNNFDNNLNYFDA